MVVFLCRKDVHQSNGSHVFYALELTTDCLLSEGLLMIEKTFQYDHKKGSSLDYLLNSKENNPHLLLHVLKFLVS